MVLPLSDAWPGGLPCPWNRGTVDTVACRKAARGKRWSQRSRPCMKVAGHWSAQEPSWLMGRLRLVVGHARNRPARSLHPGGGGRTRLPPRELLAARPRLRWSSAVWPGSSRWGQGPVLPGVHAGDGWLERRQVLLPGFVQLAGDGGVEPDRGRIGQEAQVTEGMVEHVDVAHRWRLGGGMGGRLPDGIGDLDADGQRIGPAGAD